MTNAPRVSIITPVYNGDAYIEDMIASVQAQSYLDYEHIIVDDGSTDETSKIVKRYARDDQRIKYTKQKNQGPAVARNTGLALAQGVYVTFIDADDVYAPDTIKRTIEKADETGADIVYHNFIRFYDQNEENWKRNHIELDQGEVYTKRDLQDKLFTVFPIITSGKFLKSEIIVRNKLRFDAHYHRNEDIDFTIRAMLAADTYAYVDYDGYYYRVNNPGSETATVYMYPTEGLQVLLNLNKTITDQYPSLKQSYDNYVAEQVAGSLELQLTHPDVHHAVFKYAQKNILPLFKGGDLQPGYLRDAHVAKVIDHVRHGQYAGLLIEQLLEVRERLEDVDMELHRTKTQLEDARRVAEDRVNELTQLQQSRSWRVTAPLRRIHRTGTLLEPTRRAVSGVVNMPKRLRERSADGAILTLTGYYNYGNIVQKYALQAFLRARGYNFITYANVDPINAPQSTYVVPKTAIVKTPLRAAKRLIQRRKPYWYIPSTSDVYPESARMENLIRFVDRYVWQKPFNIEDNDLYRNYIVGSDQVWRSWYTPKNEQQFAGYFFLNFLGAKKTNRISYAASFGKDTLSGVLSDAFIKAIKPSVDRFDAISVREKSGTKLVKEAWGRSDAVEVVDPTLLLKAADYSRLIDASSVAHDKTQALFYYILDMSNEKRALIERISRESGYGVSGIYPDDYEILPMVETWLKGFRDAEFAVTDSFHGTVFSIINRTPFIVIGNEGRGLSRLTDLLGGLGLSDRLVKEGSLDTLSVRKLKPIDWADVEKRLNKKRTASGDWLLKHLVK